MEVRPRTADLLLRAIATWFGLAAVAIGNGVFREAVVSPRLGAGGAHVFSTLLLCGLILLVTWLAVPWLGPGSGGDAFRIGLVWLITTVAFEFGFGRLVAGKSWATLLADYDITAGRIWALVLVTTCTAPCLAARVRGLI